MPDTQSDTQLQGVYSYRTLSPITRSQGLCTHLYTQSNTQLQGLRPHSPTHSPAHRRTHSVRASSHSLHTHSPAHSLRVLCTYLTHSSAHSCRASIHTLHTVQHTVSQPLYMPYTQSQGFHSHLTHSPAHSLGASLHTLHAVQHTVSEPLYTPCTQSQGLHGTLYIVQHPVSCTHLTQSDTQLQSLFTYLLFMSYTQFNTQPQSLCTHLTHCPTQALTQSLRASVHALHTV